MRTLVTLFILAALPAGMLLAQKKPKGDDGPIRIGVIQSLTGPLSHYGRDMYRGYLLAIEQANADGGISGTRIELDTVDDMSRSSAVIDALERLTARGVAAVLGPIMSSGMIVLQRSSERAGIPVVTGSATNPQVIADSKNLFRACFEDSRQGTAMARFAIGTLGLKRVAILVDNGNAYSVTLANSFRSSIVPEIVTEQSYQAGFEDAEMRVALRRIAATNPEAIYLPGYYTEVGRIAVLARSLGIRVPILGGDGWDAPPLLADPRASKALEGCYMTNHFSADDPSSAVERFAAIYRTRFHGEPTAMAALGHDAAGLLIAAMRKAGSSAPEAIRDALVGITIDGITGPITIGADHETTKPIVIQKIEGGKMKYAARVGPL